MTCEHCCGADKLFDEKGARKQLKKFKKSGAKGSTLQLINQTFLADNQGRTLLDIGGGIGAIQWSFLENNGDSTTDVDASEGYILTAREHGEANGWSEKTNFIKGDFVDVIDTINEFDYVTLDKVVCCYPDYKSLLTKAAEKSRFRLGMSFPVGGWVSYLLFRMASLYMYLKKNPFRTYLHSKDEIHELITGLGFERIHTSVKFPMRVWVYERIDRSTSVVS